MNHRDRSDATIVRATPVHSDPRRSVFEPAAEGWLRSDQVWTGDGWRGRGRELVERVGFENVPAEAVDGGVNGN